MTLSVSVLYQQLHLWLHSLCRTVSCLTLSAQRHCHNRVSPSPYPSMPCSMHILLQRPVLLPEQGDPLAPATDPGGLRRMFCLGWDFTDINVFDCFNRQLLLLFALIVCAQAIKFNWHSSYIGLCKQMLATCVSLWTEGGSNIINYTVLYHSWSILNSDWSESVNFL